MWVVLKINKNELNTLKRELNKKLNFEYNLYIPKVYYKKNFLNKKIQSKRELLLLGDYVFCFSKKFKEKRFIYLIKFCKGLKSILIGKEISQKEIIEFINKCKYHEISDGVISYSFFRVLEKQNYKFLSGPFANYLAQVIKVQKEKIDLLMGNLKVSFKKRSYLLNSQ
tara:strand:+ start:112 stop:615 length:504 start_codon:yes stop_codon:yes gene_type:complete